MPKKINLNKADKDQLMSVNGIGSNEADAIIAYRKEHGKIDSVADLRVIKGIREGSFDEIKGQLAVE